MKKLTDELKEILEYFKHIINKLEKIELIESRIDMTLDDYFNLIDKDIYIISSICYDDCLEDYNYYRINPDEQFKRHLYKQPICEQIEYLYKTNITVDDGCSGLTRYPISELGMTWFFNREEAEKKLEELNNVV